MKILGLNIFHADTASCLIIDGEIIAASEEERFTRVKHYSGFPVNSIFYALREGKIDINEIDIIAINSNPYYNLGNKVKFLASAYKNLLNLPKRVLRVRNKIELERNLYNYFGTTKKFKKVYVPHHNAHIYSSILCSGFNNGLGLSFDASGDFSTTEIYNVQNNKFNILNKQIFPHSLGIFYQAITQFLGFKDYGDEYKVMGLAGFGKNKYKAEFDQLIKFNKNRLFELNLSFFRHHEIGFDFNFENNIPYFENLYSKKLENLLGNSRDKDEQITERHFHIAHSLQKKFEEVTYKIINYYKSPSHKNLFLSGGCAFNAVNNKFISDKNIFQNIIIQPNSGDAGGALGAGLYASKKFDEKFKNEKLKSIYVGPSENDKDVQKNINIFIDDSFKVKHYIDEKEIISKIANFLEKGKIIAWHQDKMEYGPRALGNRSILANPTIPSIKNEINKKIKTREAFRPFAPSVLEEFVEKYFIVNSSSNYNFMNITCQTKADYINIFQSVLNSDGTARIQTVNEQTNRRYYNLIKEFYKLTNYALVLNTSLNIQEPICCNSEDTLKLFVKSDIDVLCIQNFIIER